MKGIFLFINIILFLLFSASSYSRESSIEENSVSDSVKVDLLVKRANSYRFSNADSAIIAILMMLY